MKRIVTFALAAFAFAGVAQAAGLPDLGGRAVVAVTENAYVPLNFADPKDGKGIGWEYDAFNEIAKRLNLKVEWKLSAWDPMIEGVRQGLFDVGMDGITITDERKAQVDFSDAYMRSEQFMLVRADEKRFSDKAGFAGDAKLLAGAQSGTTGFYTTVYDILDGDEANKRIKLFDTFGASVQALKTGDVDMVLMDKVSANGYIGASPDSFKIVGDVIKSEDFGFILKKGSDLLAPINAALKAMKDDGTVDKLNQKWFVDYNIQK
jgi:polar amino acid transport system substrate-binding protein